ncbi:MAG: transposase, partial [Candidatus Omnitrophica bacterium]|nr:transposase [Candidatus Omnitrophota bacterium]
MPRKKREPSPTGIYHWIARGINRKNLFHAPADYAFFLNLLAQCGEEFNVQIYHYCLMSNHVHLLSYAADLKNLILFSHFVKRKYAYYQSKIYKNQGATFERMYRSKPVDKDVYLLECARYIDRNPLRAGMVQHPEQYRYSSYAFYADGKKNDLITYSPAYLGLAGDETDRRRLYAEYVTRPRPQEEFASTSSF